MRYTIYCNKCDYEGSCDELPLVRHLPSCPKCGGWLSYYSNWFYDWCTPALWRHCYCNWQFSKQKNINGYVKEGA